MGASDKAGVARGRNDLLDSVLLARIAPGSTLSRKQFAMNARATAAEADEALVELERIGLVSVEGDQVAVAPCDTKAVFANIDRRAALEIAIVRAAAERADEAQLRAMQDSEALQSRCALVGDMDGLMHAERTLEDLLIAASGLAEDGAELKRIKIEFRRGWCAANRLKTFSNVANIRTALVAAIVRRDADAAEAQIHVFFDHLRRCY